MKKPRGIRRGFTLVEMAVVLVIMGLVGYLLYGSIFKLMRQEKVGEGERYLEIVTEQLSAYILAESLGNGTLPTPVNGFLPADVGTTSDPWRNPIRYWRGTSENLSTAGSTDLYLRIYDNADNFYADNVAGAVTGQGLSSQYIPNVGYVVLSQGPDGEAQYREVTGSTYINVLKPGMAVKDPGGAFVQREFDDLVQYKTLSELKNTYSSSAPISTTKANPTAPAGAVASTADVEENYTNLMGGAKIASDSSVPDGKVLDLTSSGDYVDLTNSTAGTKNYTNYTIMGWFKTLSGAPGVNFDVITARQQATDGYNNRTWWVVLWSTTDTLQGDGKDPGELAMKASPETGSNHFQVDTNCRNVLGDGSFDSGNPCHRDGKWHFFAVVMSNSGSTYSCKMFVNYNTNGTLVTSTTPYPYNNLNTAPDNPPPGTYQTFIGKEPGSGRNFQGYLDDILIYDKALTDTEITTYYANNKAFYSN